LLTTGSARYGIDWLLLATRPRVLVTVVMLLLDCNDAAVEASSSSFESSAASLR
jgi:hypothetical protein